MIFSSNAERPCIMSLKMVVQFKDGFIPLMYEVWRRKVTKGELFGAYTWRRFVCCNAINGYFSPVTYYILTDEDPIDFEIRWLRVKVEPY